MPSQTSAANCSRILNSCPWYFSWLVSFRIHRIPVYLDVCFIITIVTGIRKYRKHCNFERLPHGNSSPDAHLFGSFKDDTFEWHWSLDPDPTPVTPPAPLQAADIISYVKQWARHAVGRLLSWLPVFVLSQWSLDYGIRSVRSGGLRGTRIRCIHIRYHGIIFSGCFVHLFLVLF